MWYLERPRPIPGSDKNSMSIICLCMCNVYTFTYILRHVYINRDMPQLVFTDTWLTGEPMAILAFVLKECRLLIVLSTNFSTGSTWLRTQLCNIYVSKFSMSVFCCACVYWCLITWWVNVNFGFSYWMQGGSFDF